MLKLTGWQIFLSLAVGFSSFMDGLQMMIPSYSIYTPDFRCSTSNSTEFDNKCVTGCENYEFDNSSFAGETLVTKYSLVCKTSMIGSLSTSLGFGAMGLCATIGGAISDKYGRKTSITGVSIISSILYFVILRTENIFQYTVIWTFIMSISIIRYQAMMSYSVELSDTKLRFILGMMPNIYYGLGYSCLTLIAYLTQSWVGIFRVSLVLQAINCLTIFLPYSPYWLLSVGRNDEAEKVFEKVHGKIPKENETEKLKNENESSPIKKISKLEIFKMPETRRLILLIR